MFFFSDHGLLDSIAREHASRNLCINPHVYACNMYIRVVYISWQ